MILKPLLLNEDAPATLLNALALKTFGQNWYVWEPETLWAELEKEFQVDEVPSINRDI